MDELKPRIRLPATVRSGEVITIRTIMPHPMETGYRRTQLGEKVPRNIIERFEVTFGGRVVLSVELGPGVASNPYIEFRLRVTSAGIISFTWLDDKGARWQMEESIALEGH